MKVTFGTDRECRVETCRWYGAFIRAYVDVPRDLDVDHLVPLKNAHLSEGWRWDLSRRTEYANYRQYPDHLIAVASRANRSKGARGPEDRKPFDETYWCQYATDWAEIKAKWGLTMTQPEADAVLEMLDTCEDPVEVEAEEGGGSPRKPQGRQRNRRPLSTLRKNRLQCFRRGGNRAPVNGYAAPKCGGDLHRYQTNNESAVPDEQSPTPGNNPQV